MMMMIRSESRRDILSAETPSSGMSSRRESTICGFDDEKVKFDSRDGSISEEPAPDGRDGSIKGYSTAEKLDLHDPEPPYHVFGPKMKMFVVVIVSIVAALSGLATFMYFPAQSQLASSLGVSRQLVDLSITTYIIAQGIGPSFWGPLADFQGRRITLMYTLTLFVGANLALALTVNGPMLLVFRALQALGSASTISLGAGIIADLSPPSERGGYLGWFSGVRQLSLGLGPVIGGILAEFLGWRAIFWFLVIISSLSVLLIFLVLPETLRRIAGNGSTPLKSWLHKPALWTIIRKTRADNFDEEVAIAASEKELKPAEPLSLKMFFGPFLFLLEKDVFCALLFGSCVYTSWSMLVASTSYLFHDHYGFNTLQVGLCFLANGLGCVAGSILAGKSLNSDFHREARIWQHKQSISVDTALPSKPIPTSFPLEYARLARGPLYCMVSIWSILVFGWSMSNYQDVTKASNAQWIAPLLAQFACGWSATSVLTCNNALVVDLYPGKGASATALLNLSRSLMAAGGIAALDPLLASVGAGWTSVVLAGLLLFGLIPYTAHARWGAQWREERVNRTALRSD